MFFYLTLKGGVRILTNIGGFFDRKNVLGISTSIRSLVQMMVSLISVKIIKLLAWRGGGVHYSCQQCQILFFISYN